MEMLLLKLDLRGREFETDSGVRRATFLSGKPETSEAYFLHFMFIILL